MEDLSIKTAEVVGRGLKAAHDVGKFVAERMFTCGGWVIDISDQTYQGILDHMDNVIKGEE